MRFIKLLLLKIFAYAILFANAQQQNNNWYFGNRAALRFDNNNVVPLTNSQMVSIEGCASVSDPDNGSLLFYTNGLQIWDSAHNAMPNGTGLLSGMSTSSTQGVLIVASPAAANLYYVFTVDERGNGAVNGFRYSIVNTSLNNGRGDIDSLNKNILIQNNTTERLTAAPTADGGGFWVMVHEIDNNLFKAYKVTTSGINLTPVVSTVGSIHSSTTLPNGDGTMGNMKFNHSFTKLAVAIYAQNKIELFDFDRCTGKVTNAYTLTTIDNPYGLEFSADNSKLYYSLYYNAGFNGAIYQVDLNAANPANTAQVIGISSSLNNQCVGAMQLAPNGTIYVAINSEQWLSAITEPDSPGVSCNFIDKAVALPTIGLSPTTGLLGLPQQVLLPDRTLTGRTDSINAMGLCALKDVEFSITNPAYTGSISWNFGDLQSTSNTSNAITPIHVYSSPGLYTVTAVRELLCGNDTLTKQILIANCDTVIANCNLAVPDAFSPNGDGRNDLFYPISNCKIQSYTIHVYNRWGTLVFDGDNTAWDGKFKGADCTAGTYIYYVKAHFTINDYATSQGAVSLIR